MRITTLCLVAAGVLLGLPAGAALGNEKLQAAPSGKARAPLSIKTDLAGPVAGDSTVPVTVTIVGNREALDVETHVRGIDGVEVTTSQGPIRKLHGKVGVGDTVKHLTTVRVPLGKVGYLVVDARYHDTRTGKVWQGISEAFVVGTAGAQPQKRQQGRAGVDADGRRILVSPATR